MSLQSKIRNRITKVLHKMAYDYINDDDYSLPSFEEMFYAMFPEPKVVIKEQKVKEPKQTKKSKSIDFDYPAEVTTETARKMTTTRKKKSEPETGLPSNIREFTLPDGSVVYINTDKTEMEVNDPLSHLR